MKVSEAKSIAREWVFTSNANCDNISGAFYHGSVNWTSDEAILDPGSDLDLILVTKQLPPEPTKILHRDIILDISYIHDQDIQNADQVLEKYYLAGDFRNDNIIVDKTSRLSAIQKEVGKEFSKKDRVIGRCESAKANVINFIRQFDDSSLLSAQTTSWLFARGVMTHILLVAGLKNPTVRRRYVDTKNLLSEYDLQDFYEQVLQIAGFAQINPQTAKIHLQKLDKAFDLAASVIKTPYRFAGDIKASTKPIAIGGSVELIRTGYHRESMFWICATFSRCMDVIIRDATKKDQVEENMDNFKLLLSDVGISSPEDFTRSNQVALNFLSRVWDVAINIIDTRSL